MYDESMAMGHLHEMVHAWEDMNIGGMRIILARG